LHEQLLRSWLVTGYWHYHRCFAWTAAAFVTGYWLLTLPQVLCMNRCCVRDWLLVTDITTGALHEQVLRSWLVTGYWPYHRCFAWTAAAFVTGYWHYHRYFAWTAAAFVTGYWHYHRCFAWTAAAFVTGYWPYHRCFCCTGYQFSSGHYDYLRTMLGKVTGVTVVSLLIIFPFGVGRDSETLRTGRWQDRVPPEANVPHTFRPALGPTQCVLGLFPGRKAVGPAFNHPLPLV
jgi:hypothetical protein